MVKLCDEHGYTYHWTSGQKPHLIRNGKRIDCNISNYVPFVVPGLSASSSSTTPSPSSLSSSSQDSVFDVVAGLWEPGLLVPPQIWRKIKTDGLDGGIGVAGRRCHDRRCRQEAQQIIPRTTVFGSDCRECGGCDRSAETEEHGGPKRAVMVTDLGNACGSLWRQCALEAVRIHCPQMLGIIYTQWESGSTTALAIHQALLETRKKTENGQDDETRRETGELKVLAYADDAFL